MSRAVNVTDRLAYAECALSALRGAAEDLRRAGVREMADALRPVIVAVQRTCDGLLWDVDAVARDRAMESCLAREMERDAQRANE